MKQSPSLYPTKKFSNKIPIRTFRTSKTKPSLHKRESCSVATSPTKKRSLCPLGTTPIVTPVPRGEFILVSPKELPFRPRTFAKNRCVSPETPTETPHVGKFSLLLPVEGNGERKPLARRASSAGMRTTFEALTEPGQAINHEPRSNCISPIPDYTSRHIVGPPPVVPRRSEYYEVTSSTVDLIGMPLF